VWRVLHARDIQTAIVLRRSVVWRVVSAPRFGRILDGAAVDRRFFGGRSG
jgi:hypothetical protein